MAAACVFRPLVDKVGAPVVLGDICFCFDLGLGCVTNDGAVVDIRLVALVEELVAGKSVGGFFSGLSSYVEENKEWVKSVAADATAAIKENVKVGFEVKKNSY